MSVVSFNESSLLYMCYVNVAIMSNVSAADKEKKISEPLIEKTPRDTVIIINIIIREVARGVGDGGCSSRSPASFVNKNLCLTESGEEF